MTRSYAGAALAPRVPTTCVVGYGVPTADSLVFHGDDVATAAFDVVMADGDGTVVSSSLDACAAWARRTSRC